MIAAPKKNALQLRLARAESVLDFQSGRVATPRRLGAKLSARLGRYVCDFTRSPCFTVC